MSPMDCDCDSTSAAGAMLWRSVQRPILVGLLLAGVGTSGIDLLPADLLIDSTRAQQTTASAATPCASIADASVEQVETNVPFLAGASIAELRRLSGLTWEQLARLFNLSRRSLHFWASGKSMTPAHEEHLQRLLAVLRKIDRGSAGANRAALIEAQRDGVIPLDLLAAKRYEQVVTLLDSRQASPRLQSPKLSDRARAERNPRPPEELVGAMQDRAYLDTGLARSAKSVKVRGDA